MGDQKVFCMACKKDLSDVEHMEMCECGSKNFIYGNTVTSTEYGFGCSCGCSKFKMVAHINMNPKYISTYECIECGETISTEVYYESPYY